MIFFVPGYDPATLANLAVAERILPADCCALLGNTATRAELLRALADGKAPLFAMSHGRRDHFVAQEGGPAFGQDDVPRLGGRAVFIFACHTAGGLGGAAAENGSVWWGYTGLVSSPPDPSSVLLPLFTDIFTYIRRSFAMARSSEERRAVLRRLAEMCHEAAGQVDELTTTDAGEDAVSAYYCLLHIWERLRIWEPGTSLPMMHPKATPPALLL